MDDKFNLLMMISKRGFRHTPIDRRFIASQVDWVYTDGGRKLADIARQMMSYTVSQTLAIEHAKRPPMPFTRVMLSNDGTRKHVASEQLLIDESFNISLIDTTESDRAEANSIFNGVNVTNKPSDLAIYLNSVASSEVGARMSNGGSFSDFLFKLAEIINDKNEWLVPLFLVYDNIEQRHSFSITFVAKELNPTQCLKIDIVLS